MILFLRSLKDLHFHRNHRWRSGGRAANSGVHSSAYRGQPGGADFNSRMICGRHLRLVFCHLNFYSGAKSSWKPRGTTSPKQTPLPALGQRPVLNMQRTNYFKRSKTEFTRFLNLPCSCTYFNDSLSYSSNKSTVELLEIKPLLSVPLGT